MAEEKLFVTVQWRFVGHNSQKAALASEVFSSVIHSCTFRYCWSLLDTVMNLKLVLQFSVKDTYTLETTQRLMVRGSRETAICSEDFFVAVMLLVEILDNEPLAF